MKKVFLGVGHGGNDPGAVGYIKEADVNLNMALACKDYLVANGVDVKLSRYKNENDDLNEEIRECNAFNPDLAVDIHNNAGGGDGFEIYCSIKNDGSKELAQFIEEEVKAICQNSRGVRTRLNSKGNADYYGFIRNTKCKSVICEGVFVDNKADAAQADTLEEQKAFGVAYAKGILKDLGINPNSTPIQAPTPTPSNIVAHVTVTAKDGLNIRSGIGMQNKIIAVAPYGGEYDVFEIKDGWGRVNGGWFNLSYTTYNKSNTTSSVKTYSYYPACNRKFTSLVDALNSIGVNSDFSNRKKIAVKNNMSNYSGTAQQNTQLLEKLKAGRLIK